MSTPMSTKKWSFSLVLIVCITCISIISFQYSTDTYNVLNTKSEIYYSLPNQRFLSVEYILKNHNNYDTYIFGSSRVGYINPLHMKDKKAYNMTYAEGVPHEHLLIIKLFLKQKIPIKHLLIGLDDFSYQVPFRVHDNQLGSKSHYLALNNNIFEFYQNYFFRKPTKKDFKHFKNKFLKKEPIDFATNKQIHNVIYKQNDYFSNKKIENNFTQKHIQNEIFQKPSYFYKANEIENTLNDIKEIIQLAKLNNIEIDFFINPIHHIAYSATEKPLLQEFKTRLSHLTSYYDFTQISYISNNNAYWNDTSHYNLNVGSMILDKIYNKHSTVKDFGVYIKKIP